MIHNPVLLDEVIKESNLKKGEVYVDATLGLGGHASAIYDHAGGSIQIIGFDKDLKAQKHAKVLLEKCIPSPIFIYASFADMKKELEVRNVKNVSCILFDLGVSSLQFDNDDRGFSFRTNMPLHMNMDNNGILTAKEIINHWSEETIANILYGYGEEKFARRIARKICEVRKVKKIETTFELVKIINDSVPLFYQKSKIHPATKSFQALRIAVNNELEELEKVIRDAVSILKKNGRILVITFHSLEDRIVKEQFALLEKENIGRRINKKVITPSREESKNNPRARSAKLRIFQKV